jgi:hypothetical protein
MNRLARQKRELEEEQRRQQEKQKQKQQPAGAVEMGADGSFDLSSAAPVPPQEVRHDHTDHR